MTNKSVELKEEGRILLNKAKGLFLIKNPHVKKATDDFIVQAGLIKLIGDLENE